MISLLMTIGFFLAFVGIILMVSNLRGEKLYSSKDVTVSQPNKELGNLYGNAYNTLPNNSVTITNANTTSRGKASILSDIIVVLLSVIALVFLFLVFFIRNTKDYVRYIEGISENIKQISNGDLSVQIESSTTDELGRMAENINEMVEKLKAIMENERQDESAKNSLITSVAHDLRTPLTSVIGYLDLVKNRELSEEERKKYIGIVYRKALGLEKLIEDLFSYTKYNLNNVTLNYAVFNITNMMNQLIEEFYPSFEEHHLTVETEGLAKKLNMVGDVNLLVRAFSNIITNAIKYGKDGKLIKISLVERENFILVHVTNYGELIPKEDLENVFRRFYRVESSRNEDTGGSGLGLAIAKAIVELHQGSINVISDYEGTTFTIKLNKTEAS